MPTDEELIKRAQEGCEISLEILFRRYEQSIYEFSARMVGDMETAKDVTQLTFIKAYRSLKRYQEQGKFKPWLFTIARREALRELGLFHRGRKVLGDFFLEFEEGRSVDSENPALQVERRDELARVERCLSELSTKEREVLLFRIREDLTFQEIAEICRTPLGTILTRMRSGVKKLKACVEREDRER